MTYTDEDVNRWLEMYNDGESLEEIGLDVGVSFQTVGARLRKHPDYIPRSPNAPGPKKNRADAAAKPGPPIKHAALPKAHLGHRRRGRGW